MFATIVHDDTVGFKETEYGPSFWTEEEAQEYCKDFNSKHATDNWSARVGEPGCLRAWHGHKDISPKCPLPAEKA